MLSRGQAAMAEKLLARIQSHSNATPADIAWSRRNLAVLWMSQKGNEGKQKALAAIEQNLAAQPDSPDDLRAKALCLESIGGKENLNLALTIIQRLLNSRQSTPTDQLLAFRFCMALDRPSEAQKYIEDRALKSLSAPQDVVRYVFVLLEQNELREAKIWIDRLEQQCRTGIEKALQTNGPAEQISAFRKMLALAAGFQAQLAVKQGNAADAILQVERRVGRDGGRGATLSAAEAAQVLTALAKEYEPTNADTADAFRVAAEQLLRVSTSSGDTYALVAMLTRQGQLNEAVLAWTTRFDAGSAEEFAITGASLAAQPGITKEQLAEVSAKLSTIPAEKRSKPVLVSMSQLYAFQNRHQEAIMALREILKKEPNDAATLNNLACYLALSGVDTAEAIKLIDSVIASQGKLPSLLDSRGIILLAMNKPQEALRDLEEANSVEPNGAGYLHLAAAYAALGNTEMSGRMMTLAREAGLTAESLHPLERTRFQALLK
jgi:tetratricopeptide (TPR) repeat protein